MKKLKLPLWSDIVYLILTTVIPIIAAVVTACQHPKPLFKISFTLCGILLLTYILIKKFIINKYLIKLSDQSSIVELNYQTKVGDADTNKKIWLKNKLIEYIVNVVQVVLSGLLMLLLIYGAEKIGEQMIVAILVVYLSYIVAFVFRICIYSDIYHQKDESTVSDSKNIK